MATDAELAWLAGLLEGEGSFMTITSRWNGRSYRYARISIQMADLDVIEMARRISGVENKIYPPKNRERNRKQLHRLWIDGSKAVDLMRALRPWMGARRKNQIDVAISNHQGLSTEQRSAIYRQTSRSNWDKKTGLTDAKREAIRQDGRYPSAIAKEYGVSEPTIRRIKADRS